MSDNNNNSVLELEESFPVSVQRLYKAWTDEQELKEWWKPMDTSLHAVQSDLNEGGKIVYEFEQAKFKISGEYETVIENAELKYSWNWEFEDQSLNNEEFTLHILFNSDNDKTTLRVKQEGFKNDNEKDAHEEGWKIGFKQLQEHLSR